MTVLNAKSLRPTRRPIQVRAVLVGVAAGMLAAAGGVASAQSAAYGSAPTVPAAPVYSVDPAKQRPGAISVSNIDFKRGDGGAGRLIVHFNGDGAAPDLHNRGSSVVVDVGNAQLPASLQKP